jgi:hypothetical protein
MLECGPAAAVIDLPPFAVLHARVNENLDRLEAWLEQRRPSLPKHLRIAVDAVLCGRDDESELAS